MIPLFKVFMSKAVNRPLLKTIHSGYIGQGFQVERFEKALAFFLENPYVLTLNSATSALHLALQLCNVRPGDEVISTPLTCVATNWPILARGANIVWADIDPQTALISIESIAKKITARTRAIMVVDWGGQPVDIDAVRKIAVRKVHGKTVTIPIIEDAAHAFGAVYKGKKVGSSADFTCFSFQAIKHITTVDGGLLCTKTKSTYDRGKLLRWYGIDRTKSGRDSRIEEDIYEWGYKFHMNDVAATIGLVQLKHIDTILKKHRTHSAYYYQQLPELKDITLLTPQMQTLSSSWLFTIRVKRRDAFHAMMQNQGIMTSQVHRRNDTHPVVSAFKTSLPNLDIFEKEMICIPVGWWLQKSDLKYIVSAIKKGW